MHEAVIRGGMIVNHDEMYPADVGVDQGRFTGIYPPGKAPEAERSVNAEGLLVFPGFIDPHVHIGYPDRDWEEDCVATTQAAAAGGVTVVVDFLAGAEPVEQQFRQVARKVGRRAWVDLSFHAGIFTWEHVRHIEDTAHLGLPGFKLYLPYNGKELPDEWRLTDDKLWESFCRIAGLGYPAFAMVHAENQNVIDQIAERSGQQPGNTWSDFRPAFTEAESIAHVSHLCRASHCPLYIAHVGSAGALAEVRYWQRRGLEIAAETCAHYLVLNNQNCDSCRGKINPPLRESADNEAVWTGIADGTIRHVGSDHSSCSLAHKNSLKDGVPGFAGVQTTLPVLLDGVNKGKLAPQHVAAAFSYNTARLLGLQRRKGAIRVGLDADFVLVDIHKKQTVRASRLLHSADYTPFEGMELTGWPVATYLRGEKVAEEGRITSSQPSGRFLPRFCQ